MSTKRALLASSALAMLSSIGHAQAGDFYASVLGGANLMEGHSGFQDKGATSTFYKFEPDTGFYVGGAVGLHLDHWVTGLRPELEVSFRRNDVGGSWGATSPGPHQGGMVNAHMSNFSVLANVWYDIDLGSKLVPYFGGGVGWDCADFEGRFESGRTHSHFEDVESGFAWQAGAGVNYQIQEGIKIGVGYRYFQGPDIRHDVFVGKNPNPLAARLDNQNQTVMVNLTFDTN
jgi:opacity protein-like surface antigen